MLLGTSCHKDKDDPVVDNTNPETVSVSGVNLDKTTISLEVGESVTLSATVSPNNATDKTVTWSSSDETVAIVENGKVTAVKEGEATITAKSGDKTAECKVTVTAPAPKTFTITFDSDGGSDVTDQVVDEGKIAIKPEDPSKDDYTFLAWYNGDVEYDFSIPVTADITLKAHWTNVPTGYVDLGIVVDGKSVYFEKNDSYSTSTWTAIDDKTTLPTREEWMVLSNNCYWQWDATDDHKGYYVFKAKADSDKGLKSYDNPTLSETYDGATDPCIFLSVLSGYGYGIYWSGNEDNAFDAYCLHFNFGDVYPQYHADVNYHFSVLTVRRSN